MTEIPSTCVLSAGAVLAEGPVWDERTGRLYWIDIERGQICRFDPNTGKNEKWALGTRVGFSVLTEQGDMLAGTQEGLVRFSLESGMAIPFANPEPELPDNRFNDGKCDPQGRLWGGTMSVYDTEGAGSLYRITDDGDVVKKVGGVTISNGLAWTKDATKVYYIDSPTRRIDAFDYDLSTGEISNRRPAVDFNQHGLSAELGYPDGMTIDAEDKIWVALWEGWGVARFDPETGELLAKVKVPAACVTSCCFGGEDLDELYITTASRDLKVPDYAKQPDAGGVFVAKPGVGGTLSVRFKG